MNYVTNLSTTTLTKSECVLILISVLLCDEHTFQIPGTVIKVFSGINWCHPNNITIIN